MSLLKFIEQKITGVDIDQLDENHPLGHEIDNYAKMDG